MYGHVNNAVHYALADSAVNAWLIESSGVDVRRLDALGVVAETGCQYLKELSFPATVDVGIAVDRLGTSSIVYRIALFEADAPHDPCALIRFVHVYVDAATRRPVPIPEPVRTAAASAVPTNA